MTTPLDTWFKQEITVHEAALKRFIRRRLWHHPDDLHDIIQETYAKIYQAAQSALPKAPKAFLFTTAYHLLADRLRHKRVVSIEAVADLEALNVSIDEISEERRLSAREELKLLARAIDRLPTRCREVFWLRRIEELPIKAIAERLGIEVRTVDKHLMRARKLLAEYLSASDEENEDLTRQASSKKDDDRADEQSRN